MEDAREPLLVGRETELARLDGLVASLREASAGVVICGEAGIGKTALWGAGIDRARNGGIRVLRSRCAEVEMPIAFGAVSDLIEPRLDEIVGELSGAQHRALAAAFGRGEEDAPRTRLLLAGALLASMRALARRGPLLVAIDDVQWLDPGSRRMLAWALRRVGDERIGLLATSRGGVGERDPFSLADTLPPGRLAWIELGPLSVGALQHVIAARIGVHLPRPTLTRVHRASAGNPFFALEFARTVDSAGRTGPLAVPESLEQLLLGRVRALPARLRPLLELVAALERPTLPVLERALAGGGAAALVDEAAGAEVLVLDDREVVRFAHPLLASAVYFDLPAPSRRRLHRGLAAVVDGLEERARHAALASPGADAAVAELVDRAASAAAARGALDAAAELAEQASRLTTPDDPEARRRRALAAAGWLVETGEFAAARAWLDPLLAAELPASERTDALLLRAECELPDRSMLVTLLREARDLAPDLAKKWRALIRLTRHDGWVSGRLDVAVETARAALAVAVELGDMSLVALSRAALEFYEAAGGRAAPVSGPPPRGPEAPALRMPWWHLSPALSYGCRLMWAGELAQARPVLEEEYAAELRRGREARAGFVLTWLAELEWRAGDWERARQLADEATERLGDVNPTAFPRALLAACTGRTDEAYAIANAALAWSAANDERVVPPRFGWLLGLLELSRGDAEAARPRLAEAAAQLDAAGIREPGYLPVLPDLAESLVAAGDLDGSATVVERLEAAPAGHRWATHAAQRSRALLLLAAGDAVGAATLAETAADGFAAIGAPLDRARALLALGSARRRLGERRLAAAPLSDAIAILDRLGAPLWLALAEAELRRASPRPRRDRDELTPAEARVAGLVAAGRQNKEVAAALFTTTATVEAHLTRIYRKLGVRNRSELARRVADGTVRLDSRQQ